MVDVQYLNAIAVTLRAVDPISANQQGTVLQATLDALIDLDNVASGTTVSELNEINGNLQQYPVHFEPSPQWLSELAPLADSLQAAIVSTDGPARDASLTDALTRANRLIRSAIQDFDALLAFWNAPSPRVRQDADEQWRMRSQMLQDRLALREAMLQVFAETNRLRSLAKDTEELAEQVASTAKAVDVDAGRVATGTFAEYFEGYGQARLKTANLFRAAAIVVFLTAIGLAFWGVLALTDVALWQFEVARIGVAAAVGALGVYLARQAGEYREAGFWAATLAVQGRAFPALLASINDPEISKVLSGQLGTRVLSEPAVAKAGTDVPDPGYLELITKLLSRSS